MNNTTYILGVSGGADAMCMLHRMCVYHKGKIIVAHFNHRLREAADSDENFVKEYCLTHDIAFISRKEDVEKYASENKVSIETAGRILRYKFFADIAENYENSIIMTAHNKNDSVESFIMHLLRGASLNGLCGISNSCNVKILDGREIALERPLLNMSRAEIEEYNRVNNVPYVQDESNNELKYERNRIRHEIMPILAYGAGLNKIYDAISRLQVDNDYIEQCVNINSKDTIEVYRFNSLHLAIKRRIIHKLAKNLTTETISEERIDEVIGAIEKNHGGKVIQLPDGIRVNIDKGIVKIGRN